MDDLGGSLGFFLPDNFNWSKYTEMGNFGHFAHFWRFGGFIREYFDEYETYIKNIHLRIFLVKFLIR